MTLSLPREEVWESPWDLPQGSAAFALRIVSHFYKDCNDPMTREREREKNLFAMPCVIFFPPLNFLNVAIARFHLLLLTEQQTMICWHNISGGIKVDDAQLGISILKSNNGHCIWVCRFLPALPPVRVLCREICCAFLMDCGSGNKSITRWRTINNTCEM